MILICYTCKKDFKCNNGSLQKNCSMKCYYKYRKTDEFKENHRKGIENRKELGYTNCKKCNIVFKKKNINTKFCSRDCQIYFQKYDPETNKKFKEYCSKGGLSSMKVQNRRSSNEIMFFEKCVKYFGEENVESNERIFDGDDADIIIHSIKYAIEWNGEWHYNKDLNRHAGSKLEKDYTKVANFAKCGYTPYVIKDRSCASKNRVDIEFKKFLKTIETKSKEDIERETIIHCLMESIMFNVVDQFAEKQQDKSRSPTPNPTPFQSPTKVKTKPIPEKPIKKRRSKSELDELFRQKLEEKEKRERENTDNNPPTTAKSRSKRLKKSVKKVKKGKKENTKPTTKPKTDKKLVSVDTPKQNLKPEPKLKPKVVKTKPTPRLKHIKTPGSKVCTNCSGPIAPKNRSGVCNDCIRKEQRKNRPSYIQLKKELSESNYVKVGQKYKVSDNAIRKWMKRYEEMEKSG